MFKRFCFIPDRINIFDSDYECVYFVPSIADKLLADIGKLAIKSYIDTSSQLIRDHWPHVHDSTLICVEYCR